MSVKLKAVSFYEMMTARNTASGQDGLKSIELDQQYPMLKKDSGSISNMEDGEEVLNWIPEKKSST